MDLSFKLEKLDFEGPMDLLLHLLDKNKVDIMDIPIASITDQYFAYLEQMKQGESGKRLDTMSDFLVMAATLLDIKARMLLPPERMKRAKRSIRDRNWLKSFWNISFIKPCPMN